MLDTIRNFFRKYTNAFGTISALLTALRLRGRDCRGQHRLGHPGFAGADAPDRRCLRARLGRRLLHAQPAHAGMTWIKAAFLLLQIVRSILDYLERRDAISEGERREVAKQLAAVGAAARLRLEVRANVGKMTDAEIDDALRGDYRD